MNKNDSFFVTNISEVKNSRYQKKYLVTIEHYKLMDYLSLDDQNNNDTKIAFVLYRGDLHNYDIYLDKELPQILTEESFLDIYQNLLPKRAEQRLLHLLEKKDYTEKQLIDKLHEGKYPQNAIQYGIQRMKSFNYINDERYAERYIMFSVEKKSKRQVQMDLLKKGISQKMIEDCFEQLDQEDLTSNERLLIDELLRKRKYNSECADEKERAKQYNYLRNKGFQSSTIIDALNRH